MLTFSDIHRNNADEWSQDGARFTDPKLLNRLEALIEEGRVLVVEHWHYRGSRCPDRLVVEDFDDFVEYLQGNAIAGDIIDVFDISELWKRKGEPVISGKCPDQRGEIPAKGAY